ncbi:hypothetical protein [Oceanidesulfovibrio marinus]|uniref:Uncharacterized protein n=1 Tax=Oceanidesulfovibrio marinus TaxID=370038 RepID=A0A6P1ZE94_9BACT|nr:hypothetical protein [Oceanidesulfovibrio marinus]QJT09292.1 hypothetical protein E8L03_10220 [Oceanidesulfovibrio marinus]TVM32883.1 hypothetical protein DQK91_13835 [Oceanidesulfovibrio marinus]
MPISNALTALLDDTAKAVRTYEAEAKAALDRDDRDAHSKALQAKCELLEDLPAGIDALPAEETTPGLARARKAASSMSQRASQALSLNSLFYMANLLYPDDYEEGQPNELERLVAAIVETEES